MLLVGLTGGIATGKSTVARLLAARGAVVLDADDLARRAVEPGTSGLAAVVKRFGPEVLDESGALDRAAVGALVFADPEARRDLESIVHPEVFRLLSEAVDRYRETDRVVVFDAPLIVESGHAGAYDVLVVVTAPVETQVSRLMADRGMDESETRARIAAQAPGPEKESIADLIVPNEGSLEDLERLTEDLWRNLRARGAPT